MTDKTLSSKIVRSDEIKIEPLGHQMIPSYFPRVIEVKDVKEFIQIISDLSCERCKQLIKKEAGDDLIHSPQTSSASGELVIPDVRSRATNQVTPEDTPDVVPIKPLKPDEDLAAESSGTHGSGNASCANLFKKGRQLGRSGDYFGEQTTETLSSKIMKGFCACGIQMGKPCKVCDNSFKFSDDAGVILEKDVKEFIQKLKVRKKKVCFCDMEHDLLENLCFECNRDRKIIIDSLKGKKKHSHKEIAEIILQILRSWQKENNLDFLEEIDKLAGDDLIHSPQSVQVRRKTILPEDTPDDASEVATGVVHSGSNPDTSGTHSSPKSSSPQENGGVDNKGCANKKGAEEIATSGADGGSTPPPFITDNQNRRKKLTESSNKEKKQ